MAGFKLRKPVMKLAVAGSTRRERGSTKEKGYTPMVMGTAGTVGRIGAQQGTAGTVGTIGAVIIHGLSGKPAVAGKTRVWTSQLVGNKKIIMHDEKTITHRIDDEKNNHSPHSNYTHGGSDNLWHATGCRLVSV